MLAASCSFKTIYQQLDYLIPTYVEGMVSLDSMLEEKVEQRSLVLINWHRNTQLQQYSEWLRVLQQDANKELTEETMRKHIATLDSFWQKLSLKVNKEMATLLPLLNEEQREELFLNIEDSNEDFREEYVEIDEEERLALYKERFFDVYETWLGDLTEEQEEVIEKTATQMQTTTGLRLERRQLWQRSIHRVLSGSENAAQKKALLDDFFTSFSQRNNVTMHAIEKTNRDILARLTVKIVHSLTKEQYAHFVSQTDDYIRMFDELAQQR